MTDQNNEMGTTIKRTARANLLDRDWETKK